jgi:hypothetical protein
METLSKITVDDFATSIGLITRKGQNEFEIGRVSYGLCNQEHPPGRLQEECSSCELKCDLCVTVLDMRTVLRVCACLRTAMMLSPCRIRMCALQGLPISRVFNFSILYSVWHIGR